MTEKLLQYIWQFQRFNTHSLTTTQGEFLQIIFQGQLNTNQGPDFLDAKIKVGNTIWAGNIELHVKSTDWLLHKHSDDEHYGNIILHVVWLDDKPVELPFPVLELQSKVSKFLLHKFDELMRSSTFIPCEKHLYQLENIVWISWKERLMINRLQSKTEQVFTFLESCNNNWEETVWWMLAKNFGYKVNAALFEKIAQSVPLNILGRHKNQIHQVEAILLGQSGLLETDFTEAYPAMLKKEYNFFQKKYRLKKVELPVYFLRMRPANFPTIRLAQLSMLMHQNNNLFSLLKDASQVSELKNILNVTANDYWHYHFVLDEATVYKEKKLGNQMANNIIINTVVPIVFAYGLYTDDETYKSKAVNWLQQLPAEKNSITNGFSSIGVENKSALCSQALIQLKSNYCDYKLCLECAIGNKIFTAV